MRRKNLVATLPYTSITNEYFDSGDFLKVWDNLMDHADLPGFRARQAAARADGRYLGIGFGLGVELSGVASELFVPMENQPGYGAATVRLDPRGKVLVFEGDAPGGQGHETTVAQAVAHSFGIHPNDIVVTTGDTGTTPFGSGTVGARAGSYFVSAAVQACDVLKEKIARIMAHDLALADASPADFSFKDGFVTYAKDTNIKKTFREAVERIIMAPINLPEGESGGLEHTAFFEAEKPMIAFNADVCTVEVDIETGQFEILSWTTSEDVGQIINPQIVEGQMQGAIVQGSRTPCSRSSSTTRTASSSPPTSRPTSSRPQPTCRISKSPMRRRPAPTRRWGAAASARAGLRTCRARSATPSATRSAPSASRSPSSRSGPIRSGA